MVILTPSQYGAIRHPFECEGAHGVAHLPYARHCTLAGALRDHPGEAQIWLDADTVPTVDDLNELRRIHNLTGAGVVSGWYLFHGGERPAGNPKPDGFHGDYCDMLEIGFGCVLIQPWVWDALKDATWEIDTDCGSCPAVFSDIPNDHRGTTEDYAFSRRCAQAGVRIVSATRCCPRHYAVEMRIADTFVQSSPERMARELAQFSPAGSPCIRRAEPALISERTAAE